jgi:putative membrane protein
MHGTFYSGLAGGQPIGHTRGEINMQVLPDRRWLTKQYLVLATISLIVPVIAGLIHMIVLLATDPTDDVSIGLTVIWSVAGGLIGLLWAIAVPAVIMWYHRLGYQIEEDEITIRKGILTKIEQGIPLRMITDFRLQRTPYDRLLGIGSIQIQTAGQSQAATGYEGKLAGLEEWEALHQDLRNRVRGAESAPARAGGQKPAPDLLEEVRAIRRILENRDS